MNPARPRTEDGYVEDAACALAEVLRRRPVASAAACGALIAVSAWYWFGIHSALFHACSTSAAFLAGAALVASRPHVRWTAPHVVVSMLAVGFAVATSLLSASVDDARYAPVTCSTALLVILGSSFLLGLGPRVVPITVGAGAMSALSLSRWKAVTVAYRTDEMPALYAGWLALLVMLLVARRGRWITALPFAVAAVLWREWACSELRRMRSTTTEDAVGLAGLFVLAGASVFLPVMAGRAAAALSRSADAESAVRLIVRIQRDPWRTALVAVLLGTAAFSAFSPPSPACLLVVVAGMSCLAHCAPAGVSFGAFAPWVTAAMLSLPLTLSLVRWSWFQTSESIVLPEALIILYVPVAVGALVANTRSMRWPWWGCAVALAGQAIAIRLVWNDAWPTVRHLGDDLALAATWTIVVSLLVQAIATSAVSARTILAASPLASFVLGIVYFGFRSYPMEPYGYDSVVALAVGPAAALFGLAARRVRSMTALPEDHPSFEIPAARARGLVPAPNP